MSERTFSTGVRLAAKVARRHFRCWLNRQLGCPTLAFADLLE